MARTILHADLDSFYASVEQRDDPRLRGRPVLVGGGVVLAASCEAKARGIRTPISGREARRLCPDAVIVRPRMEAYAEASARVFEIFHDVSPEVEGVSIDEAFIDVTGLGRLVGDGPSIAAALRSRVHRDVGLALSVGVATTKFLAKVASAVSKPDGLLVVEPGQELQFLHPLPIQRLWGVGPVTAGKLNDRGLRLVADVAALELDQLIAILGPGWGRHLHALAHNHDARPVVTGRRRRSIGAQRAFPRGRLGLDEAEAILLDVIERVMARLRRAHRLGRTVVLRLRFADFTEVTRSHTLAESTNTTATVVITARTLLRAAWPEISERGLSKVGIALQGLSDDAAVQLVLPFGDKDLAGVDAAVDAIHDRFGKSSVVRASLLGRSILGVPMLPD